MDKKKSLTASGIGAAVAMVACFTPLLAVVLGGLGLSSWFGWIDSVFHVVLVGSVGIGIYSLVRYLRGRGTRAPIETSGGL